jgi:hypothetical protein
MKCLINTSAAWSDHYMRSMIRLVDRKHQAMQPGE